MREADHKSDDGTPTELMLRRMAFHESVTTVQTSALLLIAVTFSATSLLTRQQGWILASNFSLVALLVCCTALVFFIGLYAMQRVTARRTHTEAYALFRQNQNNLSQISQALEHRLGQEDDSHHTSER